MFQDLWNMVRICGVRACREKEKLCFETPGAWVEKDFLSFISMQLAGVLLFSVFPFTIVKAIANSSLGTQLQERMQDYKTKEQITAPEREAAKKRARERRYANGY